jgi:hypothetical protein
VTLPALTATNGQVSWVQKLGHALINNITLEIGGQQIDKHYADWLNIWTDLTLPAGQKVGYAAMIGDTVALQTPAASQPATELYIPLQFYFNRNPGLALPLIALQYHEIKLNLELETFANLSVLTAGTTGSPPSVTGGTIPYASLYVDYVYLDTDERRRFAQVAHEYLIEQLQYTGSESISSTNNRIRLNFNHPVKELIWVVSQNLIGADWSDYTYSGVNPTNSALLQLNGHDRFSVRNGSYFNLVQPFQHHTNIPTSGGLNLYSFAIKPEDHQPSGSCNFSRIDNATLALTTTTPPNNSSPTVKIFAVNYNVLRIMSGMGGLAYSN